MEPLLSLARIFQRERATAGVQCMAIQYHIFQSPRYLHLYLGGRIVPEDYTRTFTQVSEDDAFYPTIPTLIEIGYTAEIEINEQNMEEFEQLLGMIARARSGAGYRAAIAGGPPDTRTIVALAQEILASEETARTFDSVLEAYQWLLAPEKP